MGLLMYVRTDALQLKPGSMLVLVETGKDVNSFPFVDVAKTGVDGFISNGDKIESHDFWVRGQVYDCDTLQGVLQPIAERSGWNGRYMSIWEIDKSSRARISDLQRSEAFCIHGDAEYAGYVMNQLLPAGADCIWAPEESIVNDIELFRLRTQGLKGLILSIDSYLNGNGDLELSRLASRIRRMKTACSAIDYPPIYMIGEDEDGRTQ